MSPSRLVSILIASCVVALCSPSSHGQVVSVTDQTTTPTPGAGHNYIGMLNESVNPSNGAPSLRISVPTPPGRKLTLPFSFSYDSNGVWLLQQRTAVSGKPVLSTNAQGAFELGGWSYSLPKLTDMVLVFTPSSKPTDGSAICTATGNYVFTDSLGVRHALQLSNVGGFYKPGGTSQPQSCQGSGWSEATSGGDGQVQAILGGPYLNQQDSNATQVINPSSEPNIVPVEKDDGTPQIVDADGTVYTFPVTPGNGWGCAHWNDVNGTYYSSGFPASIEDRNGNTINISTTQTGVNWCSYGAGPYSFTATDTVGRTLLSASNFGSAGNTVTVAGLSNPSYTLTWGPPPTGQGIPISYQTIIDNGTCPSKPSQAISSQNVVTAITLPNGQKYQFGYDPSGYLNKVIYPTGGYVSYSWGVSPLAALIVLSDRNGVANQCEYHYDAPAIVHRYVSFDGTTVALQQDFSYSTTWSTTGYLGSYTKTTTVTTHDLVRGTTFQTVYTYGALLQNSAPNTSGFPAPFLAGEQTITYYDTDGTVKKTVTKNMAGSPPLLTCELETLDNGLIGGAFYSYSSGDQLADKKEYDYGQLTSTTSCVNGGSAPSSPTPVRETVINHQSFPATPIYPSAPSIFDKPSSVITYGNGTRLSETDYSYDQGTVAGVSNLPAGTHDETNYAASSTAPRGNATTITKQCFQGSQACASGNLVTTSTYDETGQTTSTTDANNHVTQFSYADSYTVLSNGANITYSPTGNTNAYLTKVTNPLSQTQNFTYDFNTGELTVSIDPNNLSTSYLYNDPLARPTLTTRPDQGTTTTMYNDTALTVTTSKSINQTLSVTSVALSDGLGHVKQTQLTSDPQGTVYTDTAYDGVGRAYTVSNPYRSGSDPTTSSGTTTYYYDALGRKCLEVPPDGTQPSGGVCPTTQPANTIFTTYSGNTTTVTDQTGKSRKSVTDRLGRMTQVFEDPAGRNYETDYAYDALGNLLCAGQKGANSGTFTNCSSIPAGWRARNFSYDSLSRLLTSSNPETGTIIYKYDADSNCAGPSTFMGLLVSKTDARGIRTCAQYDAINRETVLNYSNGDATITTTYDQSNCLGLSACQNIGQRTSETDAAGSEAWAYQVDATNHRSVHINQRTTSSITKASTYYLDLAGNVTQTVYPTGRVVNYTFDAANRPKTAADGSNGITYATDFQTALTGCLTGAVCYTPQGTLYALSVGQSSSFTGLNLTHTYNNRLQPQEFKASSIATAGTGSVTINGSLQSTQVQTQAATPGTGTVSISGSERSFYPCGSGSCPPLWDGGTLSVIVNGVTAGSANYGNPSYPPNTTKPNPLPTASSVASLLTNSINGNGSSPVSASLNGTTITLTAKTTGASTNYSLSTSVSSTLVQAGHPPASFSMSTSGSALTGGANATYTTVYDSGACTITVNSHGDSTSWSGSGTASSSIASALVSGINGDSSAFVSASLSGSIVKLAAKTSGSNTDYSLASSCSYDTSHFTSPSFSTSNSGSSLSGGADNNDLDLTYSFVDPVSGHNAGHVYGITNNLDSTRSQTFTYDQLNRISSALTTSTYSTSPAHCWGENYTLDAWGNLNAIAATGNSAYNGCSQESGFSTTADGNNHLPIFGYDPSGNTTSDGFVTNYQWDAESQLKSAAGVTYLYDGDGRRVSKSNGSVSKLYWYGSGGEVLSETDGAGNMTHEYIFFAGKRIAMTDGGSPDLYVEDMLGTSRVMTWSNGSLCYDADFYPYGGERAYTNSCTQEYKFEGKERDPETGNDEFGARYYSNRFGRWLSADWSAVPVPVPYANLTNPQTLNLHAMVSDDPESFADLDGHGPTFSSYIAGLCDNYCLSNAGSPGKEDCGIERCDLTFQGELGAGAKVSVEVKVLQEPKIVTNEKQEDGTARSGVYGKLQFTITVNGKPLADTKVDEKNDQKLTVDGKEIKGGKLVQGPDSTNNAGQLNDQIGLLRPAGTKAQDASLTNTLSTHAVDLTGTQTLTFKIPGGATYSATSTRTLTNIGPGGGGSSHYKLTTTQPVVKRVEQ